MRFDDVVRRSHFGTTGFLSDLTDLAAIEAVILHNLPVLQRFRGVVVATNYGEAGRDELSARNAALWRSHIPDCVLIDSRVNRGHSIGTADLDTQVFDYCKRSGIGWLCKGANDVTMSGSVLDIEVEEASFYYLNAVSYDAIRQRDMDLRPFIDGFFFPQTTFYAIDVDATDHLVDRAHLDRSYEAVQRIPGYDGRIWEHLPGWSCERLLRETVLRNGLPRCSLLSDEQWRRVLEIVIRDRITDCSFKGLQLNGICHLDFASGVMLPWAAIP